MSVSKYAVHVFTAGVRQRNINETVQYASSWYLPGSEKERQSRKLQYTGLLFVSSLVKVGKNVKWALWLLKFDMNNFITIFIAYKTYAMPQIWKRESVINTDYKIVKWYHNKTTATDPTLQYRIFFLAPGFPLKSHHNHSPKCTWESATATSWSW